jgi:hypothetical protein
MGTSAGRRAPTTRLWGLAKGAATRYLSPQGGGTVTAGEVVARYLAALGEGDQGALAAWRLTRKVAQDLGALAALAASQGWEEALTAWGLGELAGSPPEGLALGLSGVLVGAAGGLEAAVARASLAAAWMTSVSIGPPAPAAGVAPGLLVQRFLAASLHLRLALDLGEPLEAAGASYRGLRNGMETLQRCIEAAADPMPAAPGHPEDWRSLAGWTWVTETAERLLNRLADSRSAN